MTNYFTSETLSVSGESVFLGSTVLGAYALIGGDNILMNDTANTVSVVQDVSINSIHINGDASFNGDVSFNSNVTIQEKLNVYNDVSINKLLATDVSFTNLDVSGSLNVTNKFVVSSDSGNTSIGGTLGVTGKTAFTEDVSLNKNVTVNNKLYGNETLDIIGNTSIGGTLGVTGITTLTGGLVTNTISSTSGTDGSIGINGGLSVKAGTGSAQAYRTNLDDVGTTFYVTMEGNVWAKVVTTYSDSRLKHNQKPLEGLEVIRKLKPTKYDKTNTENEDDIYIQEAGFIAQEVLETDISWAVNESQTDKKYYGLNYNSVFTYGIQAIKELDEQLNLEKEKTKLLQEELQITNQELINAKLDIEKSKFEIQYIKNILEIV